MASETLDRHQIEAAVQFVDERWEPTMSPREREEWTDALAYVRVGELKPIIDRWSTSTRPTASAVLDYILTDRDKEIVLSDTLEPALGGRYTDVVVESIKQARQALHKRIDDDLVPCSPDPR